MALQQDVGKIHYCRLQIIILYHTYLLIVPTHVHESDTFHIHKLTFRFLQVLSERFHGDLKLVRLWRGLGEVQCVASRGQLEAWVVLEGLLDCSWEGRGSTG